MTYTIQEPLLRAACLDSRINYEVDHRFPELNKATREARRVYRQLSSAEKDALKALVYITRQPLQTQRNWRNGEINKINLFERVGMENLIRKLPNHSPVFPLIEKYLSVTLFEVLGLN